VRILTVSNLYPPDVTGGYELLCRQAVDALRNRGHEVQVLTSAPRGPAPQIPHVHRRMHFVKSLDVPWLLKVARITRFQCEAESNFINAHNVYALLDALETYQPDVVYLHSLLGLGGLGLLGCLHHLRVPWVWQLGDCVPRTLCSKTDSHLPALNLGGLSCRLVPALVQEFNRQIRGHYQICSRRLLREIETGGLRLQGTVEFLPYWIDGRPGAHRTRYLQGGHLRLVSAAALSREKGSDLIIRTAAQLRECGYNQFSVDLYGACGDSTIQALIDHLNVGDCVTLKGMRPQEELTELFAEYDMFLFPTWAREPFGVAPLEAAARGCVPLVTQNCGLAEWVVNGVHCLKAERSAEAFARVLRNVLDGKIDLELLGRRISTIAWRDFHIDALVLRIETALAQAATQSRSGAGSASEAYQLALLAEKCAQVLIHDSHCA
jgi:glycosyltransferase involved in cell wall biosynthesis